MLLLTFTAVATVLLLPTAIKTVKNNQKMTRHLAKIERRKLLWRYGPFSIDQHVVDQHAA